jgi:hypothetical protein
MKETYFSVVKPHPGRMTTPAPRSHSAANGSGVAYAHYSTAAPPGRTTKRNGTIQHPMEFTGFMLGQQAPVAGELKTEYDTHCLDYNYNDGNVYMHPCHGGSNQQWYFTAEGMMKTQYDDKCLDYNTGNQNVVMWDCHGDVNQQWHINPDGSMGTAWDDLCLDYNYNDMNVYMHPCHGGSNQKWVHPQRTLNAAIPVAAPAPSGELKTEYDANCLDYDTQENVYMHPCHGGANQQWYFEPGTGMLKTEWDNKCLDYNTGNQNVIMWECHGDLNQQWHINPDGSMGTAWDDLCLDYNYGNMNVYMHPCHGGSNQKWVHPQRFPSSHLG